MLLKIKGRKKNRKKVDTSVKHFNKYGQKANWKSFGSIVWFLFGWHFQQHKLKSTFDLYDAQVILFFLDSVINDAI